MDHSGNYGPKRGSPPAKVNKFCENKTVEEIKISKYMTKRSIWSKLSLKEAAYTPSDPHSHH
jgi:hypothetical protein